MGKQFLAAFSIQPGKRYIQYIHTNHLHVDVVAYVKTGLTVKDCVTTVEILQILNFEKFERKRQVSWMIFYTCFNSEFSKKFPKFKKLRQTENSEILEMFLLW